MKLTIYYIVFLSSKKRGGTKNKATWTLQGAGISARSGFLLVAHVQRISAPIMARLRKKSARAPLLKMPLLSIQPGSTGLELIQILSQHLLNAS